jgi:hypothetical protein
MFLLPAFMWLDFSILSLFECPAWNGNVHGRGKSSLATPLAGFYPAFTLLVIFCPKSGGTQVPVEGSVPRAGQERRPFGMGERQHGPSSISGVPDKH